MHSLKKLAIRIAAALVLAEVVYLALANLALNVPWTQDFVNRIRPDKFTVRWDGGWTWFPGQVNVKGIDASGDTPKQRWHVSVAEAGGRIAVAPLLSRQVRVSGVNAADVLFALEPRAGLDADNGTAVPPSETGASPGAAPQTGEDSASPVKPWNVEATDVRVTGAHRVQLDRLHAMFSGDVSGGFSVQAPGGLMALSDGEYDIRIESLVQDGGRVILEEAQGSGTIQIRPVDPRHNRGVKMLDFVRLDGRIRAKADSLAFLNPWLKRFQGMRVDGAGVVEGRAVLDQGVLLPGSDASISASKLALNVIGLQIDGDGTMSITVPDNASDTQVSIEFGELDAYADKDHAPLLQGKGMAIHAHGPTRVIPDPEDLLSSSRIAVVIPSLQVPDVGAYQGFLPDSWGFSLHGGEGMLHGEAELSGDAFDVNLGLTSEQADVGFGNFRFRSDLDMRMIIDGSSIHQGLIDVTGTYFRLDDSRLAAEGEGSDSWSAAISVEKGVVRLNLDGADDGSVGVGHVMTDLKEGGFGSLVAAADEELKIVGTVSDLRWLNLLFDSELGLAVRGAGNVGADVVVHSGRVGEGTHLVVTPDALSVDVLDYRAAGDGRLELNVLQGGAHPDVSLGVDIVGARFGRRDQPDSFIENVNVSLSALVRGLEVGKKNPDVELALKIPSARVTDMSVYNQYLPDNSPIKIVGGEADLEVDVKLQPDNADGFVRLVTSNLRSRMDDQELSGDLTAHIQLAGGAPKDREFDVSGSSLVLDGVRVIGDEESFRDEDWSANIDLTKARAIWKPPVQLEVDAEISMSDSMPIVSILANERGKHGWLEEAMTIDDVKGTASLRVDDQNIVIPSAFVSSDKIDVGAKGVLHGDSRTGMIYVRYGILKALLESKAGERNIDILNTEEQFEAYSTDEVLRSLSN